MINKNFTYAVVGASANPEKYGNQVFNDLLNGGYHVFPVNPKGGEISGRPVFASLSELSPVPDVVIFVVLPIVALEVLTEVKKLGIKKVWFQLGSESQEALNFCRQNGIEAVANACIMIQRKNNN